MMNASRRSRRDFSRSSARKRKVSTWLQAKCDGMSARDRVAQAQEERSQRGVHGENDKGDFCWTGACEGIARRMLKFLEDSEAAKVSVRDLEEQVLSPNESRIYIAHCEASKK